MLLRAPAARTANDAAAACTVTLVTVNRLSLVTDSPRLPDTA